MTDSNKRRQKDVLDRESLELLGNAAAQADLGTARLSQLRERVMQRVAEEATLSSFLTIRAGDGEWIEIGPLMEKKVLHYAQFIIVMQMPAGGRPRAQA